MRFSRPICRVTCLAVWCNVSVMWTVTCGQNLFQTQWTNPGLGEWFVSSNWNNGVPNVQSDASINQGGTAWIVGSNQYVVRDLDVGANGRDAAGALIVEQALLNARGVAVGVDSPRQGGTLTLVDAHVNTTTTTEIGRTGSLFVQGASSLTSLTSGGLVSIAGPRAPATLSVRGNFRQTSQGNLRVMVSPSDPTALHVTGVASLDGTLTISLPTDFQIKNELRVTFINAGGGIQGGFNNIAVEGPPPQTQICMEQNEGGLSAIFLPGIAPLGDFHRDNVINSQDVAAFVQYLTQPDLYLAKYPLGPESNGGDIDGNAIVDFNDADDFLEILESCPDCQDAVQLFTRLIPEPYGWSCHFVLGLILHQARCRRSVRKRVKTFGDRGRDVPM